VRVLSAKALKEKRPEQAHNPHWEKRIGCHADVTDECGFYKVSPVLPFKDEYNQRNRRALHPHALAQLELTENPKANANGQSHSHYHSKGNRGYQPLLWGELSSAEGVFSVSFLSLKAVFVFFLFFCFRNLARLLRQCSGVNDLA